MSKNIIVTGATGSLGSAIVTKLLKQEYTISAIISHGRTMTERPNLFSYHADLVNEIESTSAIEKIITDRNKIDGAVLTVGGFAMGNMSDTKLKDFEKMLAINFITAYNIIKPLYAHFKSEGKGKFILVGSRPGLESAKGINSVDYALSKSLILKISDLINQEFKSKEISSTVLVPDIIDTQLNRKEMPDADFSKWIKPEEIADKVTSILRSEENNPIIKFYK